MTSLNPVMTIGAQISETIRLHQDLSKSAAMDKAIEMLRLVKIPEPEQRAKEYPHQLSGGMRQRAMIAMALSCNPRVLIADEPTTALDVTIQAQILDLILDLQNKLGTAVVLITHDLAVVAETAHRVIVMYAGKKVEEADVEELFERAAAPLHARPARLDPASGGHRRRSGGRAGRAPAGDPRHGAGADQPAAGLLRSRRAARLPTSSAARNSRPTNRSGRAIGPRAGIRRSCMAERGARSIARVTAAAPGHNRPPVLEVVDLKKHFPVKKGILRTTVGQVYAVDGVSSRSARARRWAWSASAAAANRRWRAPCCA